MKWNSEIEARPVFNQDGYQIVGYKAVTIAEDNRVLGIVSGRYKILTNERLYQAIKPIAEEIGLKESKITTALGGRRTYFKFLADDKVEIAKDDPINFGLEFFNSYDGSLQAGYHLIAKRLVCTNGLIAPRTISSLHVRHTNRLTPELIRSNFTNYSDKIGNTIHLWRQWANTPVDENKLQDNLEGIVGKKLAENFSNSYGNLRSSYKNLWGLYNVLTYHLSHKLSSRKGHEDNLEAKRFDIGENWAESILKVFNN